MIEPCLVSKVYFCDSVWLPNSNANVPEDEAQLQISVNRCSDTCSLFFGFKSTIPS
jgi:hypothetical protein